MPEPSAERRGIVDHARERWTKKLIDLSRRNNLLFFRPLKQGTLDLTTADAAAVSELMASKVAVPLRRLLPDADYSEFSDAAREIRRRARLNLEEKGLDTLFLTYSLATWPTQDGGRPFEAPVLLIPMSIEERGKEGRTVALRCTGDPQINIVLLHALSGELGREMLPEHVSEPSDSEPGELQEACRAAVTRFSQLGRGIEGFSVRDRLVLGNFSFQKMAMVKDLRERGKEMAGNAIIAAIAGDEGATHELAAIRVDLDPRELDRKPPEQDFLVLDADSTQQRAIAAVHASQSCVINGPPGTGKSQTIANMIASLAAQGRHVLFVAEKRAALEVVLNRLRRIGLGHLALDLHGADVSRKKIADQMQESLRLVRDSFSVDTEETHRRFEERRQALNEHAERIHAKRSPSNLSVYGMEGLLLRLQPEAAVDTRWRGPDLETLTSDVVRRVQDLLLEAGGFASLFLLSDPSPWTGADLPDGHIVQEAVDAAIRLSADRWPSFARSLESVTSAAGLPAAPSLNAARRYVELLEGVAKTLELYTDAIYDQSLDSTAAVLAPGGEGGIRAAWAWCTKRQYRSALRRLRQLRKNGSAPVGRLLEEIKSAASQLRSWKDLGTGALRPRSVPGLAGARSNLDDLLKDLGIVGPRLRTGLVTLTGKPLPEFGTVLDSLAADTRTPHAIPRLVEIERSLREAALGPFIKEIRRRHLDPKLWLDSFRFAWLSSCLDRAWAEDPKLAAFQGRTHSAIVEEFSRLDHERLALAAARVRRAHGERAIKTMNDFPSQALLVAREAEKSTRHLPLRRLFQEAPDVLTALYPCWMASPLSVSQLVPGDRTYFDIVVFDEASQVPPEDAVCSLLRASQAVVAGDRHQLPPTPFFFAGDIEEELLEEEEWDPRAPEGFESVLEIMTPILQNWPLEWHYRSLDEALIAFSNVHIYHNGLVTFPSVGRLAAVSLQFVNDTGRGDAEADSPSAEVQRVVDLVVDHARNRPEQTLGVIALGMRHARRVQGALDRALRDLPELDEFFDENRPERFFVKNLERVQGDERDAIILTLGVGKGVSGVVDLRGFGPLNAKGGERRLNVAVTRARSQMTLVSCVQHFDLAPPAGNTGLTLLRSYLEYAATGGRKISEEGPTGVPPNPFELDIQAALEAKGLQLEPQYGVGRYRIDLAVRHPESPGRFVLGIECDGATYHSAPTARDRDRLREQQLEVRGWRFHRIWSADWFLRRDEEIQRALEAYNTALLVREDEHNSGAEGHDPPSEATLGDSEANPQRRPRPKVPTGLPIEQYSYRQLRQMVEWVRSDGRLRTDEEIIRDVAFGLGFQRMGARIHEYIERALQDPV